MKVKELKKAKANKPKIGKAKPSASSATAKLPPAKQYDADMLFKLALEACKDPDCVFVDDIIVMMPCSKPTFYEYLPPNSDYLNQLKDLLNLNKIAIKKKLRKQWAYGDASATLQVALYKLLADSDELARLVNAELPKNGNAKGIVDLMPDRLAESDDEIDD